MANETRYDESIEALEHVVSIDNLHLDAHYLMGVIFYKREEFDKAHEEFRKVIYIDPTLELGYYNLANIFVCQNKMGQAIREYNTVISLLSKKGFDESLRLGENLTPEILHRVCKSKIAQLT